jgi:hypothetical protein
MEPATLLPPARWERTSFDDGVVTYRLTAWSAFADFLEAQVFTNLGRAEHQFIWRGQRRTDWMLDSSLARLFTRLHYTDGPETTWERRSQEHLDDFKYAARGRRGFNPPNLLENEWWALGQHFGLATPLLDWTHSPFAAAYFAFEEHEGGTSHRVVYGLDRDAVDLRNQRIVEEDAIDGRSSVLELIDPLSDEKPQTGQLGSFVHPHADWRPNRDLGAELFRGLGKRGASAHRASRRRPYAVPARSRSNEYQPSVAVSRSDWRVTRYELTDRDRSPVVMMSNVCRHSTCRF